MLLCRSCTLHVRLLHMVSKLMVFIMTLLSRHSVIDFMQSCIFFFFFFFFNEKRGGGGDDELSSRLILLRGLCGVFR